MLNIFQSAHTAMNDRHKPDLRDPREKARAEHAEARRRYDEAMQKRYFY